MDKFIVSARKYRPDTFETVVGQSSITTTLKNAIKSKQLAHAYLFCGPRGIGKTTCARIFAKTINCTNLHDNIEACNQCVSCKSFNESRAFNIHELDAASNNSVDDIRNLIDQVRIPPQVGKYSIYIIDEVHMLSQSAFNAFLKTLEEPPAHAIFILATTEKHKIIPTILSRCQIFDFNRISVEDMVAHLQHIATKENVIYEIDALNIIAQKADGAMRDALSIFDQVASFTSNNIIYKEVIDNLNVLDYEYYFKLTEAFLNCDVPGVLLIFDKILKDGFDAHNFINGLAKHFRDLLVCKDEQTLQLLEVGDTIKQQYKKQASQTGNEFLFQALKITNECDIYFKASKNQRLHVELTLVKLCNITEKKNFSNNTGVQLNNTAEEEKKNRKQEGSTKQTQEKIKPAGSNEVSTHIPFFKSKSSISIKDALQKIEQPKQKEDIQPKNEEKINETRDFIQEDVNYFTDQDIKTQWETYAEKIKEEMPRMYSTLKTHFPVKKNNQTIELTLNNQTQADDFNSRLRPDILNYLRDKLKTYQLEINITVTKHSEENGKPYTADDKFKYMEEKNPTLGKLKQEFNLDFE